MTSSENNGIPGDLIMGGAQREANLFHSFQEFSIDEGQAAYFANPDGVENIFGRVTGAEVSEILGQLGVLGEANLFLLNPNGVVFGPNSSLDISGSFLGTTADEIGFGEQGWFSATTPEAPSPLLTINPSVFFFNQMPPGNITIRSKAAIDPALGTVGLSVGVEQNLALLGGNINIEGGRLNALGGRIDLGAVESTGAIELNTDGSLAFPTAAVRGDIIFTESARADVWTPTWGGEIAITAQRISLTGGSLLRAGILLGQGSPESQAGDILLDATEQILMNQSSVIANVVSPDSQGNAGNIEINTPILKVLDGASLFASTLGQGNAGNVIITASDLVTFRGASSNGRVSAAFSSVEETGIGNGGDIEITTPILKVLDGASLVASTRGRGNAGNVIITASDHVTFQGASRDGRISGAFGSGVFSSIEEKGRGETGGDIVITTAILEVLDGAQLLANTDGQGDAGRIIITASNRILLDGVGFNGLSSGIFSSTSSSATGQGRDVIVTTPHLQITNGAVIRAGTTSTQRGGDILIEADQVSAKGGGQIITTTASDGPAGTITINADLIHLLGRDPSFNQRVEEFGTVIVVIDEEGVNNEGEGESGLFANTRSNSTGNGGSITLNIIDLVVSDQAQITAQSQGSGTAGDVNIQARESVFLNNYASISADTGGGQGDIDLAARLLLLRDNSTITTNARDSATGGNIDIEADFIVAAPNENSDIFANALQGSGGQITLTALGIFGLEFRTREELQQLLGDDPANLTPRNLPSNDVTAFSQANPNVDVGTVIFRTPDVDPSRGLVELPVNLTDASQLIAQTCPTGNAAANQANEFTITGRGGLPPTPSEAMNRPAIQVDLVTASTAADPFASHYESIPDQPPLSPAWSPELPIVEAQGFHVAADGTVRLIAADPVHTALSLNRQIHCQ